MTEFPGSVTVFLPAAGAILLVPIAALAGVRDPFRGEGVGRGEAAVRWWALAITLATFAVSLGTLASFDATDPGFQLVEQATWVEGLNFQYLLGVDGISIWLVLLTTFLMPVAVLASWGWSDG